MFFSQEVEGIRETFFTAWAKFNTNQPLNALEAQIVTVIKDHPEFHPFFNQPDQPLDYQYFPELGDTNPFLHLGLHLAIREQISTNRPVGIRAVFEKLVQKHQDTQQVEHLFMEQLAEFLWLAQKNSLPPDEFAYLKQLESL